MAEWIDDARYLSLFAPGQRVYVGGSANEPKHLVGTLARNGERAAGITFIQQPLAVNDQDFSSLHETASQETFFATPALKDGLRAGRVRFIPMQMRAIYDHLASDQIDVALLAAARDVDGVLRYGPNVDYAGAALAAAKTVVVEVSDAFVAPLGGLPVDESAVQYLVPCSSPVTTYPVAGIDDTSRQIGNNIASLIRDGDCLQTGIGAVPAAVLDSLTDKNDLGFHGGLIDDAVMALIRSGNLTGRNKEIDAGEHLTGMALGTSDLHDWLAQTASVRFTGANYTHEISVISQLSQFVSINSAVEVDLFGQVNAEVAGGRQISGTGGAVDFMRSARVSKGGRSIVALSSTARGGTVSRIVPKVEMVTALRTDVDLVVTEHGVADLKRTPLRDRASQLIGIAHPDFRDELQQAARAAGLA